MKSICKYLILSLALLVTACGPDDATRDYGFAKVYIPQATVTGLDNSYPIPLGPFYQNSVYTCKYDKQGARLDIALGVTRSGHFSVNGAYSVDLVISRPDTDRKLAEYAEKEIPATELQASFCTIPEKVSVEAGQSEATFYVSVDMKALAAQQAALYTGGRYKLLVLGLAVTNLSGPAGYELADSNTSVVIILDLNSEHWDNVAEDKPESEIRNLFPIL